MDESPGKMYALAAVLMIIAIIAVLLRFYARSIKKTSFGWDDWLMLPALLFTILTGICIVIGAAMGDLGRHTKVVDGLAVTTERTAIFQKVSYWTLMTQTLTFGLTKLGVLLFYKRLFSVSGRLFMSLIWTMIVLIVMWTIAFFFANFFQCVPLYINWVGEGVTDQNCIDETSLYIGQAYSDIISDVLILSIPIPLIWRLHMPAQRKIAVSCIFLLGSLVVAAGIVKLIIFYQIVREFKRGDQDLSYFLTPVLYWPMVESSLGILGACLPTYRPIFMGMSPESLIASIREMLSLNSVNSSHSRNQSVYTRQNEDAASHSSTKAMAYPEAVVNKTDISSGNVEDVHAASRGDFPMTSLSRGILVKKDFGSGEMV